MIRTRKLLVTLGTVKERGLRRFGIWVKLRTAPSFPLPMPTAPGPEQGIRLYRAH